MLGQNSNQFTKRCLCTIIVSLLLLANPINAQEDVHNFWIDFGVGVGSVDKGAGGANLNAAYQFGENLISARIAGCGKIFGKSVNDYSILYGRAFSSSTTAMTSAGIGLGIVEGTISHGLFSDTEKIGPVIGVPLEAQLFWRPLSFLGLGLYAFANINSKQSFVGCTISLQIGKLR